MELRRALELIRRDGWTRYGWGGRDLSLTADERRSLRAARIIGAHTIKGALRTADADLLGAWWAERYLLRVLPCSLAALQEHPHTDEQDVRRAFEKAIALAEAETEEPARAVAAPRPSVRRGVRR